MKKKNIFIIILACIVMLTGCTRSSNIEDIILNNAKTVYDDFQNEQTVHMNITKKSNRFLVSTNIPGDSTFTIFINSNFYEKNDFELPEFSSEDSLPKLQKELFEKSQQIVLNYIDNSKLILSEDKEGCKSAVRNVTIHYCSFEEDYQDMAMTTYKNEIYVNQNLEKYLCVYLYIHELIHVISNYTNQGSLYEFSSYRGSNFNEAITDLIAVQLTKENDLDGYELSAYQYFYDFSYFALSTFDNLFESYYYSDEYSKIFSENSQNEWDLFILLLNNIEDNDCYIELHYLMNEWKSR